MNVVLIKHHCSRSTYLFQVPQGVVLKDGDEVIVETRNGEVGGICVCDSFELDGSPLNAVGTACGASFPLKSVVGRLKVERFRGD